MIKKIRQLDTYFLLHYPQLWNLRIVWMAPAIIILHILFYIAGYVYFSDNTQLHGGAQISQHMVSFGDLVFSELVGILLIILWLVFYLRNNPLKSFYPLPRWYWVIEVSVVFTILLGCTTLYTSFARGYWDSIDHHTKRVDLTDEVNTLNLAYGLLPVSDRDYSLHACCDSLHYTEGS
jgi:magnesium-transporting ATPase (P-type)